MLASASQSAAAVPGPEPAAAHAAGPSYGDALRRSESAPTPAEHVHLPHAEPTPDSTQRQRQDLPAPAPPLVIADPQGCAKAEPSTSPPPAASASASASMPAPALQPGFVEPEPRSDTHTVLGPAVSLAPPARTPSPVLADDPDGHLSFPLVGGLDAFEREMQTLINADDIEEPAQDELTEIYERLAKLGISPESLESETHDTQLGVMADLMRHSQQQEQANERLRHHVRITRLAALSMLSSLRVSYSHMLQAERDIKARLEVELSGSKSQSRMLSGMMTRASAHVDDTDDTFGSPIVSERNKLLSDRRFLKQRVRDAEAQVGRLESELRALRPLLLRQQPDDDETPPSPQSPRRRRNVIMGDAKSEHLILAARMLRTLRHRTGGESPKVRREAPSSPEGPATPRPLVGTYPATPQSTRPRTMHTPRLDDRPTSAPQPFTNGIDELLHAAQSLTGDEVQSPTKRAHRDWSGPLSAPVFGSPKRQRMRVEDSSESSDRQSMSPTRAAPFSALDVLADQASEVQPARGPAKNSPEKRLPYVRWSAEEDVKLRKAIKEHGQRWEFVARAVGTRSYHQCRQRYLLIRRKEAAANGTASPGRLPQTRTPNNAPPQAESSDEAPQTPNRPVTTMPPFFTPSAQFTPYMPGALPSPTVPGAPPGQRPPPPPQPFSRTRMSPAVYS